MSTAADRPPCVVCPECGARVEPRTVPAFDPRLREVTIVRARCWACGWERTTGPERRQSADGRPG
jgi:hypothetical protein